MYICHDCICPYALYLQSWKSVVTTGSWGTIVVATVPETE